VERAGYCLSRQLDHQGAQILQKRLEKKGLNFVLKGETVRFSGNGKVKTVHLKDGRELKTDFVLLSAGIRSNTKLVEDSPLKTDRGIIVDQQMKTNIADIYAAGDVAEHNGRVFGTWPPSMEQGSIAGKNIVGKKEEFEGYVSSYSLKVVGVDLLSIGKIEAEGEDYKIEKLEKEDTYKKIIKRDQSPIGAIMVGDIPNKDKITKEIKNNKSL
jgi:nitrite reductase (NADH) large subunit